MPGMALVSDAQVRCSELMAAISLATDLGMGLPLESGLAICLVTLSLADRLGTGLSVRQRCYQLALLQHIGCTAAASQVAAVMGDEMIMRAHTGTLDFADRRQMLGFLLGHVARVSPPLGRPAALARAIAGNKTMTGTVADVCEAAVMLGERFGYDPDAVGDLGCVYEHWDGSGFPGAAAGDKITEPAQVVQVASLAVAAHRAAGAGWAADLIRQRRGHSLAPAVADAFLGDPDGLLWPLAAPETLWDGVIATEPAPSGAASAEEIDRVLLAVADFVDLKSPYLAGHSSGVGNLAAAAAAQTGLRTEEVAMVRRAGWLHDIGRIGISASIWNEPGPLSAHQWEQVRLHPYYTGRVLDRTPFLSRLAAVASAHHERLDGSGYFRATKAGQLNMACRVLAAADAYQAMTEPRPHRPAMAPQAAARELRAGVDAGRLDGTAAEAVLGAAGQPISRRRPQGVAGLTARETDIMRQVARGLSIKQIARELSIAPKTVDGHIQRIYAKIGVSTRAGATLFALSHGLLPDGENRENSP
jgi:HD-GYP domain-containing protein (c-di-GMP phosphodiesterase class II)